MSAKDSNKHTAIEQVLDLLSDVETKALAEMVRRYEDEPSTKTAADLVTKVSSHMEKINTQARGNLLWTVVGSEQQVEALPVPKHIEAELAKELISTNTDIKQMLEWQRGNRSIYANNVRVACGLQLQVQPAVSEQEAIQKNTITTVLLDDSDDDDDIEENPPDSDLLVLERLVDDLMSSRGTSSKTAPIRKKSFKNRNASKKNLKQKSIPMIKASLNMIRDVKSGKVMDQYSTSK